jgi:pimeloyl-ACP methyl ester carboxylesterase
MMDIRIKRDGGHDYVEEGTGPTIVLLHGLFGALSNWQFVLGEFSKDYHILIPIYRKTKVDASVDGLAEYVKEFLDYKGIEKCVIMGNSLGGHIGLIFTIENRDRVRALVLTGSSGLFESGMGSTFPRRGNYEYIRERVAFTFYNPATASKELIDEVFEIINDNYKALRIVRIARAAQRQNLRQEIATIRKPALLVWGLNDNITPPNVAHEFNKLLPGSDLRFIDACGHAAMMEKPLDFNKHLKRFLTNLHLQKEIN